MLALLIQSIYNIVDSLFIARYSQEGLTALSIVYPIQLLMVAVATGTGAGVNILIARMDGQGEKRAQSSVAASGFVLTAFHFLIFAFVGVVLLEPYFRISSENKIVCEMGVMYSRIVFCGSLGTFVEGICTKILQARGNMVRPMMAQIAGALVNVVLDPILIFGVAGSPELGIEGAAVATVIGQGVAAIITLVPVVHNDTSLRQNPRMRFWRMRQLAHRQDFQTYPFRHKWNLEMCFMIYRNGIGSIATQSLYTLYIVGLNMILKLFTEDAVTVLGIYYKVQTFFFIPLLGLQQVLLPVISNHYGAGLKQRIHQIVRISLVASTVLMSVATLIFMAFPQNLLEIFSSRTELLEIGNYALRVISLSFIPAGITIVITSYLQGIAKIKQGVFIVVLRQVILLVPLAWVLHFYGLNAVWWTFPITEVIAAGMSLIIRNRIEKGLLEG